MSWGRGFWSRCTRRRFSLLCGREESRRKSGCRYPSRSGVTTVMAYGGTDEALSGCGEARRGQLARGAMEAVVEPAPEHSGREYTTSRVILSSFEGRRIRAWYTLPKDRPRGRFAAMMTMPGY